MKSVKLYTQSTVYDIIIFIWHKQYSKLDLKVDSIGKQLAILYWNVPYVYRLKSLSSGIILLQCKKKDNPYITIIFQMLFKLTCLKSLNWGKCIPRISLKSVGWIEEYCPLHIFCVKEDKCAIKESFMGLFCSRKQLTRAGVAIKHCTPVLMKHVLPRFLKPHTPASAPKSETINVYNKVGRPFC